ncbi:MAG: AsmA family protein, partial [Dissulfurispiraceae bacterium]
MKRKIIYITIILLIVCLVILLRGTNVSNALKGIILPELEHATGEKITAQKIYINLFPLYIGVKNINALDNDGKRLFSATSVKGYIGLSGLLTKEIIIKKIVVREPEILLARNALDQLINNIKRYLSEEKKMPFEVSIKSLAISGGAMTFKDNDMETVLKDMNIEATLSKAPRFQVSSTLVKLAKAGIPELRGSVRTEFSLKDKKIELKSFKFVSLDSEVKTSGNLWLDEMRGFFRAEADIFVDSFKIIFGLKNRGEGRLHAEGSVTFDNISSGFDRIFVDLKLKGDVYLETLMELLKVSDELKGHIEFDGNLKGYFNDLTGSGKAKLIGGDIFGVDVDKLDCKVNYKDGIMRFEEGKALLYNGSADIEAQLKLPIVDYFSFKVVAKEVSSKGVVKLIKWDPHLPEGKISGEIASSGNAFNPHGGFIYMNSTTGGDVLGRIQEIKGDFSMKEDLIDFKNIIVSTGKSQAVANGSVNLHNTLLNLVGHGTTSNTADLSAPYFTGVSGPGEISFLVSGTFEDPLIDLTFRGVGAHFSTASLNMPSVLKDQVIRFDAVEGTVTYRKNLLTLKNLSARSSKEEFKTTGRIFFPKAHTLFELAGPEYDLQVTSKNMSVKELAGSFSGAPPLSGTLNAGFAIEGKPEDISFKGDFSAEGLTLYDIYSADHLDGKLSYEKKTLSVSNMSITRGATVLQVNGKLFVDKRFVFEAKSKKVNFLEVVPEKYRQLLQANSLEDVKLTELKVRGDGTLENPNIEITSMINGGTYRAFSIGTGDIKGTMKGKQVNILAHLFDSKVVVKAEGTLSERLPWSLVIDLKPGRYDFLLAKFIKDVPEDLLVNLKVTISA